MQVRLFYGLQSLRQLALEKRDGGKVVLSNVVIRDYPRFPYRGLHLDVSRHFYSKEFIKKQLDVIDEQVRKPARKLSTDWRINVKMTDSVTEGKYALCRKALTSLEIWARTTLEDGNSLAQKQADYERDKKQCESAIAHPQLGNTDPKQVGVAS